MLFFKNAKIVFSIQFTGSYPEGHQHSPRMKQGKKVKNQLYVLNGI
jgi:hypothetical protein